MEFVTVPIHAEFGEPFYLVPLGDIQWAGDRGPTAKDLLKQTIDEAMEKNAWFIGMGDYIDFASPSNRQRIRSAHLYDQATEEVEEIAQHRVNELCERYLAPTKGRWLGLLEGHHFIQFEAGHTSDMLLADMLGAVHLGTTAWVRLMFKIGKGNTSSSVIIWATHGSSGSSLSTGPAQRLEKLAPYWDADIMLHAHMTKMPIAPLNRVFAVWPKRGEPYASHKKVMLIGTGGFQKGYMDRAKAGRVPRGSYVEQRTLPPVVLGAPTIKVVWNTRDHHGERHLTPTIKAEV